MFSIWNEPVELLQVLLPRLEKLKISAETLGSDTTAKRRSDAALNVFRDLCTCMETFSKVNLQDDVAIPRTKASNALEDRSWLIALGKVLVTSLEEVGLEWPPPGQNSSALVNDLLAMYASGTHLRKRGTLSSTALADILKTVGLTACQLARDWPQDLPATSEQLAAAAESATTGTALVSRLTLIATLAQAMTLPTVLLALGPDLAQVVDQMVAVVQIVGHDAVGMAMTIGTDLTIQSINNSIERLSNGDIEHRPSVDREEFGRDDIGFDLT